MRIQNQKNNIFACIHTHIHMSNTYMYTHTDIYTYMYMCVCMHVCMLTCVHACMYVRTYACVYACINIIIFIRVEKILLCMEGWWIICIYYFAIRHHPVVDTTPCTVEMLLPAFDGIKSSKFIFFHLYELAVRIHLLQHIA